MPILRPTYQVELPDGEVVQVVIASGDQLRAELAQNQLKLPPKAAMHLTVLWIWAAMVRTGLDTRKAGEFIADPPEWEPLKDEAGEPILTAVDPTKRDSPGSG